MTDSPPLTRARIVDEAVALLDSEGIAHLTMRRLATRLSTAATTLYWHVETKDDVLDLALDAVLGEIDPVPQGSGRAELTALLHDLRGVLLRHPWSTALFGGRPLVGPNALGYAELLQSAVVRAGCHRVTVASYALSNYVLGCVSAQTRWQRGDDALRHDTRRRLLERADHYPTLAEHWDVLDDDWDTHFTQGLQALLDGLRCTGEHPDPADRPQ